MAASPSDRCLRRPVLRYKPDHSTFNRGAMPPGQRCHIREGLGHRSVSAVIWGMAGTVLRTGLQIVSQIVLARLLGPEQFGLFAIALAIVFFTTFFADVGLAYGLIQRKSVVEADVRFVFTWQLLLGIAVAIGLLLAAPLIARIYGDIRLVGIVRWLALVPLINACGSTAGALLRRDLEFKWLNLAAAGSYAIGFLLLGIPMALYGFGVDALLAAFLVQSATAAAMTYARNRHAVRPLLRHADARSILGFGGTVLATNVVNWTMTSMDRAIIGNTLGLTAAGLYATIYNFITAPALSAHAVLQPVFYAASAKVQDDPLQLRHGFRTMLGTIALFATPFFCAIAVIPGTFVQAVYGDKWLAGATVLTPLALAMPAFLMMGMATPVLWASGQTTTEFRLQVPIAIVWALVLVVVARLGSLTVLSWAVFVLFVVRAVVIIGAALRALTMSGREVPSLLWAAVAVSAGVTATAAAVDSLARLAVASPHGRLAMVVLACGLALVIGLRLARSLIRDEVSSLLMRLAARAPGGEPLMRRLLGG